MMKQFYKDLAKAKPAENFCTILFDNMSKGVWKSVENVSDDVDCRKLGDIRITKKDGTVIYIDVKDESRFADEPDKKINKTIIRGRRGTGNLLAEDWNDRYKEGWKEDGFMRNAKYDYVAVFSWCAKYLLLVDFRKWREVYKKPEFIRERNGKKQEIVIHHPEDGHDTHGYLNEISKLEKAGVIAAKIFFDYEGTKENPTNVRSTKVELYDEYFGDIA